MFQQLRCCVAALAIAITATCWPADAGVVVRSASGVDPAAIQAAVDQFRADLGSLNPPGPCLPDPCTAGRREINWDAVPDGSSSPNVFPGDFFNGQTGIQPAGRIRGALFTPSNEPTDFFQVSADADNPTATAAEFGDIDPSYDDIFQTFSAERLFAVRDDTTFDTTFFVPGTTQPAFVKGFGAVFTDVDANALIRYFDDTDTLVHTEVALAADDGLSFVGVSFDAGERITRVQIISGNTALNLGNIDESGGTVDIVVMDDFVFGEPLAVPEPSTWTLAMLALAGFAGLPFYPRRRGNAV